MEQLKLNSKFADKEGEILVVELKGYVDHSNSDGLQKMFSNIAESDSFKIIVDFAELEYMSSVGWGIFVGEIKRFRNNGGDIKLTRMRPEVYDVFHMLEFYHIFEEYSTIKEAFDSFDMQDGQELNYLLDNDSKPNPASGVKAVETSEEVIDIDELLNASAEVDQLPTGTPAIVEQDTYMEKHEPVPAQSKLYPRQSIESIVKNENIDLANLPISEKLKQLIARQPLLSTWGIKKVLGHKEFGHTKIGFFKLKKILKSLDLESKKKRYRFYRSC